MNNIKFSTILKQYSQYLGTMKLASHADYTAKAKELLEWLENENIDDLSKVKNKHLEAYMSYVQKRKNKKRKKEQLTVSSINKIVNSINTFSKFLKKTKGITLPFNFSMLDDESNFTPNILTTEQVAMLFKATYLVSDPLIGARDRAILALLYFGALRSTEVANLKLDEFNIHAKEIIVSSTEGRNIKNGYERKVVLTSQAVGIIMEYITEARSHLVLNSEYLIISERGKNMSAQNFKLRVRLLCKLSGDPELLSLVNTLRAHDLRGTFASHCLDAGMRLEDVKMLLGHLSSDSTQRYVFQMKNKNEKK